MRAPDAAADGGADGAIAALSCEPTQASPLLALVSAQLGATPPLRLTEHTALRGDGSTATLMTQQNVTLGVRWQGDRMFMLGDAGFWEIPTRGDARWYPTSSTILWGVRAGDLDADGDQDLLLLSMLVNPAALSGGASSPLESRLSAWERTSDVLVERGEVMHSASMSMPMPYQLADVDGDGDLDVIAYESGTPVAYVNAGAFAFTRMELGDNASEYAQSGAFLVDYRDRNDDGHPDLLVIAGSLVSNQLENSIFVLLGGADGRLGHPEPPTTGKAPLVPHGPDGDGVGIADVTGDGLADVMMQDPQSADRPILRLHVSVSTTSLAPAVEIEGLGFEFADVDADGETDIVTTRKGRLVALLSRGGGAFEARELGVDAAAPAVRDYVVEPPATLHMLYELRSGEASSSCSGRCVFGACVECLSDADCAAVSCSGLSCAH